MKEIWKDIVEYEGLYTINNYGVVKNHHGKVLKERRRGKLKNYPRVVLYKDGEGKEFFIHRLVALTFIDNPDNKPEIDHIDRNPSNNRVDNLRWVTHKENMNNDNTKARMKFSHSMIKHDSFKGKHHTEETKLQIGKSRKGKYHTEECKQRMSEVKRGVRNPMYGKHWKVVDGKRVYYKE